MKTGKDISTLFREGERKLSMPPSQQVWRKLESRLDERQSRQGRVEVFRWMAVAATLLVLVVSVYFWSASQNNQALSMQLNPAPQSLEELDASGGCQPYCLMLEVRSQLPKSYQYPVEKGG